MPDGPSSQDELRTPRQRARAETLRRIKDLAWDQVATEGAAELSLRAIARELGVVSSAIYRYYGSRDELITDLIVEAYDDLADRLEAAGTNQRLGPRRRWLEVADAFRAWAVAHPHRYGLVYGSAIPGYAAPRDTVAPAMRVIQAFAAPVQDRHRDDGASAVEAGPIPRDLRPGLTAIAEVVEGVDDAVLLAFMSAFARLIGTLTLELGGHFVGSFEPADSLYAVLMQREADALGL